MKIESVNIKNYRLLKDVCLTLDSKTTLIVGRNNTGKTSFAEIFRSFLSPNGPKIRYEDFNQSCLAGFEGALNAFRNERQEEDIRPLIPTIELKLSIDYTDDKEDFGILGNFIIDLDDTLFKTHIVVSYQLKDGKIKEFFQGFDTTDRKQYFLDLKSKINQYFETVIYAIEPTNPDNRVRIEFSIFNSLIISGLINAQRGLDDETHSERDVLGKSLGSIFKSANSDGAPEKFKAISDQINEVVKELQNIVDTNFQQKVGELLPKLSIFGYPGLQDPNLNAITELNVKSLLESNTRVLYEKDDHFTLPETYNGLGIRNLIFILFRIYEYFRIFQSQTNQPKGHLIFIEEPEAHLHPQMQEVFIRQLEELITVFKKQLNDDKPWPVQFVVSTHSSHIANETDFSKVRYFLAKDGKETKIKDLGEAFNSQEAKKNKDFLHKYLTLTKCDLYFADRAILIEGATERILLPEMIKKVDKSEQCYLRRKYMSIVEVGGAYAHHFYEFIDFLELKTLFITDLDSVEIKQGKYSAIYVSDGSHSSNKGLSNWFSINGSGYAELGDIRSKSERLKVSGFRRLAFQVPEDGSNLCGRSFEDAFILANTQLFNFQNIKGIELEKAVFKETKRIGKNSKKTDFAIEYAIEKKEWVVPKYISEGLKWLAQDDGINNEEVQP